MAGFITSSLKYYYAGTNVWNFYPTITYTGDSTNKIGYVLSFDSSESSVTIPSFTTIATSVSSTTVVNANFD